MDENICGIIHDGKYSDVFKYGSKFPCIMKISKCPYHKLCKTCNKKRIYCICMPCKGCYGRYSVYDCTKKNIRCSKCHIHNDFIIETSGRIKCMSCTSYTTLG